MKSISHTMRNQRQPSQRRGVILFSTLVCLSLLMTLMVLQGRILSLTQQQLDRYERQIQADLIGECAVKYVRQATPEQQSSAPWTINSAAPYPAVIGKVEFIPDPNTDSNLKTIQVTWGTVRSHPIQRRITVIP